MTMPADAAATAAHPQPHSLWFTPPVGDQDRRRTLTRDRVVAEACPSSPHTVWTP
jgi:hypothetical protein